MAATLWGKLKSKKRPLLQVAGPGRSGKTSLAFSAALGLSTDSTDGGHVSPAAPTMTAGSASQPPAAVSGMDIVPAAED